MEEKKKQKPPESEERGGAPKRNYNAEGVKCDNAGKETDVMICAERDVEKEKR